MPETKKVTKLRLSDGVTYRVFDDVALHMDENGNVTTGIEGIDYMIINMGLKLTAINDKDITITNVLSKDVGTNEIFLRDANKLLADIGGYSCSVSNEILNLKLGK